jgi:hypothetical protein
MAYFHFLIDASVSHRVFQNTPVYTRLMDQLDHLIELNQYKSNSDQVGLTIFNDNLRLRILTIPITELRNKMQETLDYKPGSAIIDAMAMTSSWIQENLEGADYSMNILVFSDFEENASRFHTVETLGEQIKTYREEYGFEFYAFGLKRSQESLFIKMNFSLENLIFLEE